MGLLSRLKRLLRRGGDEDEYDEAPEEREEHAQVPTVEQVQHRRVYIIRVKRNGKSIVINSARFASAAEARSFIYDNRSSLPHGVYEIVEAEEVDGDVIPLSVVDVVQVGEERRERQRESSGRVDINVIVKEIEEKFNFIRSVTEAFDKVEEMNLNTFITRMDKEAERLRRFAESIGKIATVFGYVPQEKVIELLRDAQKRSSFDDLPPGVQVEGKIPAHVYFTMKTLKEILGGLLQGELRSALEGIAAQQPRRVRSIPKPDLSKILGGSSEVGPREPQENR